MSSSMGDVPGAGAYNEDQEMDSHDQIPPCPSSSFKTSTPANMNSPTGEVPDAGPIDEHQDLDSHDQTTPFLTFSVQKRIPAGMVFQLDEISNELTDSQIQSSNQDDKIKRSESKDIADTPVGNELGEEEGRKMKRLASANCHSASIETTKLIDQNDDRLDKRARYRTDHKERGCFVIFNQKEFDLYNSVRPKKKHLKSRDGTDIDANDLVNTFKDLGFEYVKMYKDQTKAQIVHLIRSLSEADHSNYDYFGCAVLTHGGKGGVLYARDAEMNIDDFTKPFRADLCPTLAGKPKLFFIQACQGTNYQVGQKIPDPCHVMPDELEDKTDSPDIFDEVEVEKEIIIPSEADFLIANSTVEGYFAWRNMTNGSWFIQSLCSVFNSKGKKWEIMQLMTRVNATMAFEFESSQLVDEKYSKKKQIPSIVTRLTAEVYFPPKRVFQETQSNIQPSGPSAVATSDQSECHNKSPICIQNTNSSTSTTCNGLRYHDCQDCPESQEDAPTLSPQKIHIVKTSMSGNVIRYMPDQWVTTTQSDGSILLEQKCDL